MRLPQDWIEVSRHSEAWTTTGFANEPVNQWMAQQGIKLTTAPLPNVMDTKVFSYCNIMSISKGGGRCFYRFNNPRHAMLFKLTWV